MFKVTEDIIYVGVNDHEVDLFEGQYDVPNLQTDCYTASHRIHSALTTSRDFPAR